jgi:hypothetical protein
LHRAPPNFSVGVECGAVERLRLLPAAAKQQAEMTINEEMDLSELAELAREIEQRTR